MNITFCRLFMMLCLICVLSVINIYARQQPQVKPINSTRFSNRPVTDESPDNINARTQIEQLLNSNHARDRAWGLYLIGKYHQQELQAELVRTIETELIEKDYEDYLILIALDSLIQLHGSAPAELLITLYHRYPNQSIILLLDQAEDNQQALLQLARSSPGSLVWLAICNRLSELKTAGFAAYLLSELKTTLAITVVANSNGLGYGRGYAACGCGSICSFTTLPPDLPPFGYYRLSDQPMRDAVVLAPGKYSIYYQRVLSTDNRGVSDVVTAKDRDQVRVEYLAQLLGSYESFFKYKHLWQYTIVWQNELDYRNKVKMMLRKIETAHHSLITQLKDKSLLTESEANMIKLDLEISVGDDRANTTIPLPNISRESHNEH